MTLNFLRLKIIVGKLRDHFADFTPGVYPILIHNGEIASHEIESEPILQVHKTVGETNYGIYQKCSICNKTIVAPNGERFHLEGISLTHEEIHHFWHHLEMHHLSLEAIELDEATKKKYLSLLKLLNQRIPELSH